MKQSPINLPPKPMLWTITSEASWYPQQQQMHKFCSLLNATLWQAQCQEQEYMIYSKLSVIPWGKYCKCHFSDEKTELQTVEMISQLHVRQVVELGHESRFVLLSSLSPGLFAVSQLPMILLNHSEPPGNKSWTRSQTSTWQEGTPIHSAPTVF